MNFPTDLKYTKDHEWARIDGEEIVVGITDFAQRELGDIVYLEVETIGDHIEAGELFGSIEAVKTVSELFMPVSGTVIAMNEELDAAPENVNTDPYGEGWMVRIKPDNLEDLGGLISDKAYQELVGV